MLFTITRIVKFLEDLTLELIIGGMKLAEERWPALVYTCACIIDSHV